MLGRPIHRGVQHRPAAADGMAALRPAVADTGLRALPAAVMHGMHPAAPVATADTRCPVCLPAAAPAAITTAVRPPAGATGLRALPAADTGLRAALLAAGSSTSRPNTTT